MLSISFVALIFSYITDWIYTSFVSLNLSEHLMHDHHSSAWWEIACGIVLVVLILKGVYIEEIKPKLNSKSEAKSCH